MSSYTYSGVSAGSWNSLIMCIKRDNEYVNKFIESLFVPISKTNSIEEIQYLLKHKTLENFDSSDFDFTKLHIGVTLYKNNKLQTKIYSNFLDLPDAINCCMASSHIPLITGNIIHKYKNILVFDGSIKSNPYLLNGDIVLEVKHDMWYTNTNSIIYKFIDAFSMEKNNMEKLYWSGYTDAKNNHHSFSRLH
jgi:hypothetical protein